MRELVRDYLALGLRLGRLVEGFVDCWFGDQELVRRIDAEPRPDPFALARTARELLVAVDDTDLAESRRRFLAGQLRAMERTALSLTGARIGFRAEVCAYFDIEIDIGDTDRYAKAHDALAELLPGTGPLAARLADCYDRNQIPPEKLHAAAVAVSAALRERVRDLFALPASEQIEYEVVTDKPWNAFNRYLGGFASRVTFNADAGRAIGALPIMVTHESYPGHHTDHCVKQAELVDRQGHGEHVIALVNTPQCLIAEGMAELGVDAALGPGWGRWTEDVLAEQGVRIDGELVEAVLSQLRQLWPARQDAALLLHDRGVDTDTAQAYLRRWLLLPPDRAEHMTRFLTDPLWRAYTTTYVEGSRLIDDWLAARPAGESIAQRYGSLLPRAVLPADLRAELATAASGRADA